MGAHPIQMMHNTKFLKIAVKRCLYPLVNRKRDMSVKKLILKFIVPALHFQFIVVLQTPLHWFWSLSDVGSGKLTWVKSPHVFLQFWRRHKTWVTLWLWTFVRRLAWNANTSKYSEVTEQLLWAKTRQILAVKRLNLSKQFGKKSKPVQQCKKHSVTLCRTINLEKLSPVCFRAWAMREEDTENDMPHRSHWYGFSPVCRRLW